MNENRIDSPAARSVETEIDRALSRDNMFFRSLYMIVATAIMFSLFGGLVGWLLAILTPAYFRNVYDAMDSDVWQVGIGLGITRGLFCGLVVGSVALLATAWYRSRIKAGILQQYEQDNLDDE